MSENLQDASVLHDAATVKSDILVRRWCELCLSCANLCVRASVENVYAENEPVPIEPQLRYFISSRVNGSTLLAPRRASLGSALENSTRRNYLKIRSKSVNPPADASREYSRMYVQSRSRRRFNCRELRWLAMLIFDSSLRRWNAVSISRVRYLQIRQEFFYIVL